MKISYIKIASFVAVFIFLQILVLPWMDHNQLMPLWADIGLLSLLLTLIVALMNKLPPKRRNNGLPE